MKKFQNFYIRSSLFVILSLTGAAINYLLYPVLSRIYNLQEFGDFVTIVGLSNQVMGILLAFSVISIAFVKKYGEAEANQKTQVVQKVLLWVFLGLSGLLLLFSPMLKDLLNIQDIGSFLILAMVMLVAVPSNIWVGYLQGNKEFIRVGMFSAASAAFKFVFVVGLAVPFGVLGGLGGFFVGSALGLFVLYFLPGKEVPKVVSVFTKLSEIEKSFLKKNKGYILQAVFVVAGLVFLQNYDLNRAKALFDPEIAGAYGGISVLSNALYYVGFLLIWILLPEFSLTDNSINKRILKTAYGLMTAMAAVIVVLGLSVGDQALGLLLGESFAGNGSTLVVACLYQISLVAVALYAYYLLVMRKRRSIFLTASVLLCCLVIPLGFTSSPASLILSLWLSVIAGVVGYCLLVASGRVISRSS